MKKPSKKTLAKWRQMTEQNLHSEVRLEIAKWYRKWASCDIYEVALGRIFKDHNKQGHLDHDLLVIRRIVTNSMLDEIRKMDEDVYKSIYGCL